MESIELYVLTRSAKFLDQIDLLSKNERFLSRAAPGGGGGGGGSGGSGNTSGLLRFSFSKKSKVDFRKERQSTFALRHVVSLDNVPEDALIIAEACELIMPQGRLVPIRRSWVIVAVETDAARKLAFVKRFGFRHDDVMIEDDMQHTEMLNLVVLKQVVRRLRA